MTYLVMIKNDDDTESKVLVQSESGCSHDMQQFIEGLPDFADTHPRVTGIVDLL